MTKVLVIEDERVIRENLVEMLELENFELRSAANGKIGVELAQSFRPDVIICDVMMPELDGYGVLKTLRADPMTATIPFIFLTARADKLDLRAGMELGADDYLTKPCTPDELLTAIATRLEKQAAFTKASQEKLEELRSSIRHALPHELRTPLNGILGFSELLIHHCDKLDPEEVREMAESINESGRRLYRLVQNFLLYAELELVATHAEQIQLLRQQRTMSCKAIIAEVSQKQAKLCQRETDLRLELQEGSAQIADNRLIKVVEELVENAFKFSTPGTPVRIVSVVDQQHFSLSVIDRGRGMTTEQIANLGAYMQFERKLYEQQGSGLGLSLAKRLVELHGGEFTVESIPSQQTTVRVVLPV